MIHQKLLNPKSIAVIGASQNVQKPGGKVLKNLLESGFDGEVYAVNPKESVVQSIKCYQQVEDLPQVDCAIIAIAAKYARFVSPYCFVLNCGNSPGKSGNTLSCAVVILEKDYCY